MVSKSQYGEREVNFKGTIIAVITVDHWKPDIKKWRYESHCYGPKDCANYRPGKARSVPGRKPGMVWIDDDVERAENDY